MTLATPSEKVSFVLAFSLSHRSLTECLAIHRSQYACILTLTFGQRPWYIPSLYAPRSVVWRTGSAVPVDRTARWHAESPIRFHSLAASVTVTSAVDAMLERF